MFKSEKQPCGASPISARILGISQGLYHVGAAYRAGNTLLQRRDMGHGDVRCGTGLRVCAIQACKLPEKA